MMRKIALLAAHDVNFHNSDKLLLNLSHTGEMEQYGLVWGRVIVEREIKFLLLFKLLRTYLFVVTIIKHIILVHRICCELNTLHLNLLSTFLFITNISKCNSYIFSETS